MFGVPGAENPQHRPKNRKTKTIKHIKKNKAPTIAAELLGEGREGAMTIEKNAKIPGTKKNRSFKKQHFWPYPAPGTPKIESAVRFYVDWWSESSGG